jgi:hypothetical protein
MPAYWLPNTRLTCRIRLVYLVEFRGLPHAVVCLCRSYWDIFNMFAQGVLGSAAVSAASGSAALKKSGELFNAPQKVCAGRGGGDMWWP